jgi:hypothetical protein
MFIIRIKSLESGEQKWILVKTKLGQRLLAFSNAEDAQFYLASTGSASFCEAVPREALFGADPSWLKRIDRALLFPSRDVLLSFLADKQTFPYETFEVDLSNHA